MDENTDVDWVFGALRRHDTSSGTVVEPHSFYDKDGKPKDFLSLQARSSGDLKIITDDRLLECTPSGRLSVRRTSQIFDFDAEFSNTTNSGRSFQNARISYL